RVREAAVELKRSLFDKELIYIYEDYLEHCSRESRALVSWAGRALGKDLQRRTGFSPEGRHQIIRLRGS
ncbi:MAG: hypothetical protein QHH27_10470, partial [Clostridia bacterium]|nr:hypothetical protein [Clostridia bacterium]